MKSRIVFISLAMVGAATLGLGVSGIASAQSSSAKDIPSKTHIRHLRIKARLNQAERDGTITGAQKTAVLDELKILKAQHKSDLSSLSTPAQRHAEHSKLMGELQSWANSNNFPISKIFPKRAA